MPGTIDPAPTPTPSANRQDREIVVRGAREHNLRGFDVALPRGRLTVVTGVSGSGKSSLAFDTIFREGQRRFLETLPGFARRFAGRFARPEVASIEGLGPAVAVAQRTGSTNPRSTVGTLTEVWDFLRLLFARLGTAPEGAAPPTRGLFSFNGEGACPRCRGLGVEDRLDPELLVADPTRSLRDGALRLSTPNGYLMYSQVTLAVLDDVLRAHGGSVDVPWRDLAEESRRVVLHGSDRLRVPYGKHPLESRLRWTGITPRPRQEGFYRGLLPVMEEILRGKRNDSILRFVRSSPCSACGGTRLNDEARTVRWQGRGIAELGATTAAALERLLLAVEPAPREREVFGPLRAELAARCRLIAELGLDYLAFDRAAPTLSLGELQRLRLLALAAGDLRGLVLVLDEPSAGLHPHDVRRLLRVLRRLRDRGQTVVVVEHDVTLARNADWLIDLGPGPGAAGGRLLWSGPPGALPAGGTDATPTQRWLAGNDVRPLHVPRAGAGTLALEHLQRHNLRDVAVRLRRGALNVVTGVSGAGKTSLLDETVERLRVGKAFERIVTVSAAPIGQTPRSNAATYSGAFDRIRDLFAATPEAQAAGLGKGAFTFNTAGGRCEVCEGAGVIETSMRHLGTVTRRCGQCEGRRFHAEVLAVRYRGKSIADVLEGSVADAARVFREPRGLARILAALLDCGLGYLPLGQPATTLSGGEAQRVKLATELARAGKGDALIALDEPTTGLHADDVRRLLAAWDRLLESGHTLLVADHDPDVVRAADHVIDLGPGSGPEGGAVVVQGTPAEVRACAASVTGAWLRGEEPPPEPAREDTAGPEPPIELLGVATHNLRRLDVAFPSRGLTVVTGPSGSGKSSLVFDTLLAEAQNRFNDLVSPWARRLLPRRGGAELDAARGLQAAVAVPAQAGRRNPRSRVGTATELDETYRVLFSRAGERRCGTCGRKFSGVRCACGAEHPPLWSSAFSPNTEAGACPRCRGLGFLQACDPEKLVDRPERSLADGAMDGSRFGAYLGERDGRFVATLLAAGETLGIDFRKPWHALSAAERACAMHGAGDRVFDVAWAYRRGRSAGVHRFSTPWAGFATLVDEEYARVHLKAGPAAPGEALERLLSATPCPGCGGERLAAASREVTCGGKRLPELSAMTCDEAHAWFAALDEAVQPTAAAARRDALARLQALRDAGLGYLSADRELATLSGGEAQRVRLASALRGGLTGATYVLDEPTQGLHPRDRARLARVLRALADAGNAVVAIEHDPELIALADRVLELGPGAGREGGRLTACGTPAELAADPASRTGRLLRRRSASRTATRRGTTGPGVLVRGATLHNLRGIDVAFPAGALTAVTGASGSGKSTLVQEVLGPSLLARARGRAPVGCARIETTVELAGVLALEQGPAAPGSGSTVATMCGIAERLRERFAATAEARSRKLTPKHFSTATPGGRCEVCEGRGTLVVAMDLLPDVTVGCEACGGRRFRDAVLECRIAGQSIADVLDAPVEEAWTTFGDDRGMAGPLQALREIGLGYLRLGQEGARLSAGESQRLRLARILAEPPAGRWAILLDEPTRGLGFEDVERLVESLRRLAKAGHLVVVVEHDAELIAAADGVVELGPGGGPDGGRIVFVSPAPETPTSG